MINIEQREEDSMAACGELFCPHSKGFCVEFQTNNGTLKGLSNEWHLVDAKKGCEWENQQHGRGHHLKLKLKNLREGQLLGARLVDEEGNPVANFIKTKAGVKKPTMLIGVDPRSPSLGLPAWSEVHWEGSLKWWAASEVKFKVGSSNPHAEMIGDDQLLIHIRAGSDLIIPFRVEVLSATKGAGNFSRYAAEIFETNDITGDRPMPVGWKWQSPQILVEAKWLPVGHSRGRASGGENKSVKSQRKIDHRTPSRQTSLDDFETAAQTVVEFLEKGVPKRGKKASTSTIGYVVQNLRRALDKYEDCVSKFTGEKRCFSDNHGDGDGPRVPRFENVEPERKVLKRDVLSSPPRGPKIAPIPESVMSSLALPERSFQKTGALGSCTSFPLVDMLAEAASRC